MAQPLVTHISDTARWVAVYRAWETKRRDALFNDPFADRLAGDRGRAIAATMPRQARSGWPLIMRTKLIDDLVLQTVHQGSDCILNLAAGLDTRPYRLPLPPTLRWTEADLPGILAEKEQLLADATPVCQLTRIAVDLADTDARRAFLAQAVGTARRVTVITEGLLAYLEDETVRDIARDLAAQPAIHSWIVDVFSPAVRDLMQIGMGRELVGTPLRFAPPEGVAFFENLGWRVQHIGSIVRAAARARRLPWFLRPFMIFPDPDPRRLGAKQRWSAVLLLER